MNLLRDATFRNLWAAHTISAVGTLFGALSLTALIYLDASPPEMGVLAASASAPVLLLALYAGVWVDRVPRIPMMIAADLGRCAALISVPLAALAGALTIEQLWAVAFVTGCLNVLFEVAFRSALPALVPGDHLVEANSAIGMSESVAGSASPAVGGGIAQTVGAPFAVLVDALTFLFSGMFMARLRDNAVRARAPRRPALAEAIEGARAVAGQPSLRAILAMVATYSFFSGFILTLYGLWVIDGVGFSASVLGILLASGGVGSIAGAWLASPTARSLGLGRSIVATYLIAAGLSFLTPLAAGPVWLVFVMLLIEQCVGDTFWTVHNIHAVSLRQQLTPGAQLGRVNSLFLFASQGLRPLGALVAGVIAEAAGLRAGLLISCVGINVAGLWLVFSPLWARRDGAASATLAEGEGGAR